MILNTQDYELESQRILSHTEYYKKITGDPFKTAEDKFNKLLNEAKENKVITQKEFKFIKVENPCRSHFYHIPKIHTCIEQPPGRPIISGINSLMCNMSHYLDLYLQEYVRNLPSFVKDSDAVIKSLDTFVCAKNIGLLTLDVTALYSNIYHHLGITAIDTFLKKNRPRNPWRTTGFFSCIYKIYFEKKFLFTTNPCTDSGEVPRKGPKWPHLMQICSWVCLKRIIYTPCINIDST